VAPAAAPCEILPVRVVSERTLLFLVGAVQFVNVLDFMMVMPLGPDFAARLGIPASQLGLVGGAYTAAAAVAGVLGASFLDRFDRRKALGVAMLGLVAGTAAGGVSRGLGTMVLARVVAGAFGGPATALSISIVADAVPPERRGKALGAVMGAFSVASVLGVPAGLEAARLGGWRAPFFGVAILGLALAGAALKLMPPMTGHPARAGAVPAAPAARLLRQPVALLSLAASATSMLSGFSVIPNLAAFVQYNLGFPRERLGLAYMIGGVVSFAVLRVGGRVVDRLGAPVVATAGTALFIAILAFGLAWPPAWLPVLLLFGAFMTANSLRNVSASTLSSRVPGPTERARFLSTQSAVQHLSSALGATLSTRVLTVEPDGRLAGMRGLAMGSAVVAAVLPLLLFRVAALLRARDAREAPPADAGVAAAAAAAAAAGTGAPPPP
jgi:predicted MFS family arabinose efflux permease